MAHRTFLFPWYPLSRLDSSEKNKTGLKKKQQGSSVLNRSPPLLKNLLPLCL